MACQPCPSKLADSQLSDSKVVCPQASLAASCTSAKGQNHMNTVASADSALSNPSGVICLLRQL